ncbi:MAG: hypothetical protein A3H98_02745 [Bacteroidetes bacterium RIFCSPLOWO2_02_FULL_36_8]|nr:MAG: hypothetical protein A3H98_02745 [Bacteroidetes bacterium RIFCSPLOWO2_02_FULL_36_8]OFY72200.1 MAG: hypothetical protein A3G23_01365 [Bacteroidetes bacterium RIFCSPLOWO2_12_FULL_37_12]
MALISKRRVEATFISRPFTGREKEKNTFSEIVKNSIPGEHKIMTFYGVGGMGKSTLRKELGRMVDSGMQGDPWISACIDFDDKHNFPNPKEDFTIPLRYLAFEFTKKYKFSFRRFDLGYAYFWKNSYREHDMKNQNWVESSEILNEVIKAAGDIPFVGAIPHIAKAFNLSRGIIKNWWEKKENEELKLFLCCDNPHHPANRQKLLYFFADDLKSNLEQSGKRAVIFLDTYERFQENISDKSKVAILESDAWVRDMVRELPGIVWVILGRQRLRWEEVDDDFNQPGLFYQNALEGLSGQETISFLSNSGVADSSIQQLIIQACNNPDLNEIRCYPYYLDLCLDLVSIATQKGTPVTPDLLGKSRQELSRRFLMWLDNIEINTLKVLSVPRYWNDELAKLLIHEFKTGYSIINLNSIRKFSFIHEIGNGTFKIHGIMQQSLNQTFQDDIKDVHRFLANYYTQILLKISLPKEITEEHEKAFSEAFYHLKNITTPEELLKNFQNLCKQFSAGQKHDILLNLLFDFENLLGEIPSFANLKACVQVKIGEIFVQTAKYKEAESILEKALKVLVDYNGIEHLEVSLCCQGLGLATFYLGKYDISENYLLQSLAIKEKVLGEIHHDVASIHNCIGAVYLFINRTDTAEKYFRRSAVLYLKVLKKDLNIVIENQQNANLFSKTDGINDFGKINIEELSLFEKAQGDKYIDLASTLNNLADLYFNQKKLEESEPLLTTAYKMRLNRFGLNHPTTAYSIVALGNMELEKGNFVQSEKLILQAREIFLNTLSEHHPRVALAEHCLAELLLKSGRVQEAFAKAEKSLNIRLSIFNENHHSVKQSRLLLEKIQQALVVSH